MIRRWAAYVLLTSVYCVTWLVARLGNLIPRRRWTPRGRIAVTGTFHNPNWYLSHMTPLARSGVREVILVVDEPQLPLDQVRFVCPPKWVAKVLTRAGAKAIWMIIAGLRYRPDLYMGYYLAPGACTALVVGRLFGRPSCYQMTGGPVECIGGGFKDVEGFGRFLKRPSKLLETLALAIIDSFALVVVRGTGAKECLTAHKIRGSIAIITGSISDSLPRPPVSREIHLVFVGRLAPVKQVDQFIRIVQGVSRVMPSVRAVIVGDGPLRQDLQAEVERSGLTRNIEFLGKRKDVPTVLANSRVFVLTSQSEGLSIAMAEAMAAGTVPVVADVGDLHDLVADGRNGYLIRPNCIDEYTEKVLSLLQDQTLWESLSQQAVAATARCRVAAVARKWGQHLRGVISQASGHHFLNASEDLGEMDTMRPLLRKTRQ